MEAANFPETLVPIPAFMASYVSQKSETFLSTAFRTFYPWRHTFLTHSPRWVNIVITEQERRICCPRLLLAVFGAHTHPTVLQHTWLSGVSSQVRTLFRITTVLLMAVPFPDPFICERKLQESQHYFLYKIWNFFKNLWTPALRDEAQLSDMVAAVIVIATAPSTATLSSLLSSSPPPPPWTLNVRIL